jgi:serine/threonine protein kinase
MAENPFVFPINFIPIGIQYEMTDANFADVQSLDTLLPKVPNVPPGGDRLRVVYSGGADLIVPHSDADPSSIQFVPDGPVYKARAHLGSGASGTSSCVTDDAGTKYCLKRLDTMGDDSYLLQYLKEAVCHFILYSKTMDAAGNSDYVPRFYRIARRGEIIYFLTEMMSGTFKQYIETEPDAETQGLKTITFLTAIIPKLRYLFTNCEYNHGDFKADNAMYDERGNFKLIDFGSSRLAIGANVLETTDYNKYSSTSRDLTKMVKYALITNLLQPTPGAGVHRDWVDAKMNSVMASHCEGLIEPAHAAHDEDLHIQEWDDINVHFNEHNNTNGTFDAVALGMPVVPALPPQQGGSKPSSKHTRKHGVHKKRPVKTQTRTSKGKPVADLSVEFLYNFLRFHAFTSVPAADKKKLFLKFVDVPLRKRTIFKQITAAVRSNDFQTMQTIVKEGAQKTGLGKPVQVGSSWHAIVDAYFVEKDPARALNLLRTLIFFNGELGALKRFISNYKKSKPEIRSMMTSGLILNAYTI